MRPKLLLLALVCSVVPFAHAQDLPSVAELMQKAADRFDELDSWSGDIEMNMVMMGMPMAITGRMAASGQRSNTEMTIDMMGQQMSVTTVTDGEGVQWTDMNMMGERQVIKMDRSDMPEDLPGMGGMSGMVPGGDMMQDPSEMLSEFEETFDMQVTGRDELDGTPVYTIEGKLREGETIAGGDLGMLSGMGEMMSQMGVSMEPITLTVGAEDYFMRSLSVGEVDGQPWMTMRFKNVTFNPELPEDTFSFTPPDDVPVIDMAEMLADMSEGGGAQFVIGEVAPDFEGTTLGGETLKLSDFRGKVVLIDFWATWCAPCVKELPNVIETYEAFHDKGFEIVAISLDDEKAALENFLEDHPKMTWPQIYEGKGWESAIGAQYGVEAIPFTLLLDRNGVIVGMDLRGDELYAAVEEQLGS